MLVNIHAGLLVKWVVLSISPAVSLWDLFDGNAHLVTQVSPCIDHSISSPTQNHPVTILIVVVLVLQNNSGIKYTKPHKSNKNKL